jgi:hypothetical protein
MPASPPLTVIARGDLAKHVGRLAACWACITLLLWAQSRPFSSISILAVLIYTVVSSVAITALGLAISRLRHHESLFRQTMTWSRQVSWFSLVALEVLSVVFLVTTLGQWWSRW